MNRRQTYRLMARPILKNGFIQSSPLHWDKVAHWKDWIKRLVPTSGRLPIRRHPSSFTRPLKIPRTLDGHHRKNASTSLKLIMNTQLRCHRRAEKKQRTTKQAWKVEKSRAKPSRREAYAPQLPPVKSQSYCNGPKSCLRRQPSWDFQRSDSATRDATRFW